MALTDNQLCHYLFNDDYTDSMALLGDLQPSDAPTFIVGRNVAAVKAMACGGYGLSGATAFAYLVDPAFDMAGGDRSFSCWYYADNYAISPGILSNWANPGGGVSWLLYHDGANLVWVVRDATATDHTLVFPGVAPVAAWTFVCLTYNSATGDLTFRVNNAAVVTGATPSVVAAVASFAAGSRNSGGASLHGAVDDVRAWDRVLTGPEQDELFADAPPSNAAQFDNFASNHATWNQGKYASTVLVKAVSPTDHPYVRLTMSPKDDSGPLSTTTTRRVRNYYTIPPHFRWMQYRLSLDLTTNYQRYKEDGFRWYERIYKDAQDVYLQAPCCAAGLIPVSFVHPLEPKTSERMAFSDIGNLNSLFLKFRWIPTFSNTSVEADQEFVRIGYDGLNYISVTMLGAESKEREWDINDRYGLHEPRFSIKRVRAGVTEWTEYLVVYYSYPGGTPGADRLLDDAMEFEIVQKSGEVWGLTVRTAGVTGQVMHSANTAPFAASGPTTLTYTGWGYFTAPTVLNTLSTEPLDNRGPGRVMLSGRSGTLRRLSASDQNTVLIGDRDPTSGNISTLGDNPYLQPDSFSRADNPDLGSKWSTDIRTGAGWYIESNVAKCSGTGVERYTCLPRHTKITCGLGDVKMNDNGVRVGMLVRYEYDPGVISRGITAYCVYLTQTGPAAANLVLSRFYKGVEEVLATEPLVAYTAGASCMLALYIHDTTRLYATASVGVNTVTADYTDTVTPPVLTKPGRLGMYAVTGGPAEIVEVGTFTVLPFFTTGVG
jgi:hypothetical protein